MSDVSVGVAPSLSRAPTRAASGGSRYVDASVGQARNLRLRRAGTLGTLQAGGTLGGLGALRLLKIVVA